MRLCFALGLLALTAACGADGAPERPEPQPRSGPGVSVSISGSAEMGISG
ncbi:MAG TPA: argininosuccinate lyase [Citreicella sp.]|nr:argininosuccinate lyase [Citreicella sp.]HBT01342.1 argininosuccinate lyase [Citreicella sp.]